MACSSSSVFTNALPVFQYVRCKLAGPLRHVHASRVLGLLRDLRPAPRLRLATRLSRTPGGSRAAGTARDGSHVPCVPIGQDGRPTLPRQPRRAYAADIRRGLWGRRLGGFRSRPPRLRAAAHCTPAPIRQVRAGTTLTGFYTLVPRVRLLALLAGPAPSGSADASRRCRGCFPPSPASPGSGCPQLLPGRCDDPAVVVFHLHSVTQNFVAHQPVVIPVRIVDPVRVGQ